MKYNLITISLILVLLVLAGCTAQTQNTDIIEKKDSDNAVTDKDDSSMIKKTDEVTKKEDNEVMSEKSTSYAGRVLAGKTTPYIEFNEQDYNKALSENKIILLNFYANWCPICKAEEPKAFAAFSELKLENVVAFRVNYKDSQTDSAEESLAQKFQVPYQHTKVIIKDGKQVLKAPDSWDKQRYITELESQL